MSVPGARMACMRRLIAPLLAGALLAAGCSNGYGSTSSGAVLCHADDSIDLKSGVIVGSATASCTVPPTTHHLTVYLLYQPGGTNPPSRGTMTSKSSQQIPAPGADVTLTARHTCLPGTWWVQMLVAGSSPDGTPFSTSDTRSLGNVSMDDCNRK